MKISVILLSYKRAQNIPMIINSIKSQNIETFLVLWNNNPEYEFQKVGPFAKVDLLINSKENKYCNIRWELAKSMETDFVMIIDDDLYFADNSILKFLLESSLDNYKPNRLFGVEGVILDKDLNYFDLSQEGKTTLYKEIPIEETSPFHFAKPYQNINVDIVKGRLILFNKNDLQNLNHVPLKYIDKADDITYSIWMAKGKQSHLLIGNCDGRILDFENKNDENSLSSMKNWKEFRNDAVKHLIHIKGQIS